MLKKWILKVTEILLPQKCLGCKKEKEILCRDCLLKTALAQPEFKNNVFSVSSYRDPVIKRAVWLLKYQGIKTIAEPLAELLFLRATPLILNIIKKKGDWLIIPVPISNKRRNERGFNQSELLTDALSIKIDIPSSREVLIKHKHTPTQVSIKNRKDRLMNLIGSFSVKNKEALQRKNVLLIDDVATTGATMKEASKILKENGARKIVSLVVARD